MCIYGKRGFQLSIWVLVEILLLIALILPLFVFVSNVSEDTFFERNILAKDTALLMGVVQSVPGDVHYSYENNLLNKFNISFDENELVVRDGRNRDSYPFYMGEGFSRAYVRDFDVPSALTFIKESYNVNVEEGLGHMSERSECPPAGDRGKISSDGIVFIYPMDERAREISGAISSLLDVNSIVIDEVSDSGVDLPVLIAVGTEDLNINTANVHYLNNNRESRAFGCHVHNNLIERDFFDEVMLLPGLGMEVTREDIGNYAAVLIFANPEDRVQTVLGRAIKDSIREYDETVQ